MDKMHCIVDQGTAKTVAQKLIEISCQFLCVPWPEGQWKFTVKAGDGVAFRLHSHVLPYDSWKEGA